MREIALLVVLGILAVLLLFVNPTRWLARIATLLGMAVALITAAALLPDDTRTSVMELFTPGQFVAMVGIAVAINVSLVCAALYSVAKFYPHQPATRYNDGRHPIGPGICTRYIILDTVGSVRGVHERAFNKD